MFSDTSDTFWFLMIVFWILDLVLISILNIYIFFKMNNKNIFSHKGNKSSVKSKISVNTSTITYIFFIIKLCDKKTWFWIKKSFLTPYTLDSKTIKICVIVRRRKRSSCYFPWDLVPSSHGSGTSTPFTVRWPGPQYLRAADAVRTRWKGVPAPHLDLQPVSFVLDYLSFQENWDFFTNYIIFFLY